MRIVVIGAGGIGGYYGGGLAQAGHDVTLLARGENLAALQQKGLTRRGPDGETTVPVRAVADASALPAAELALVTVKSYSLAEVAPAVRLAAERGATVLPLLNGVTAADDLAAAGVPAASIVGGLTRISAVRVAPGVYERRSAFQEIVAGELDGRRSARVDAMVDAFRSSGIESRASEQISIELWQKYVFISAMAAACGLTRSSVGPIREARLGSRLLDRAVAEVVAVARARGIAIPADETERTRAFIERLPDGMKPSFLLDLEAGGPNERETLSGTVTRLGESLGVPTPVHDTAVAVFSTARR
jgi:2-dehydropantoate 2-reductase